MLIISTHSTQFICAIAVTICSHLKVVILQQNLTLSFGYSKLMSALFHVILRYSYWSRCIFWYASDCHGIMGIEFVIHDISPGGVPFVPYLQGMFVYPGFKRQKRVLETGDDNDLALTQIFTLLLSIRDHFAVNATNHTTIPSPSTLDRADFAQLKCIWKHTRRKKASTVAHNAILYLLYILVVSISWLGIHLLSL